MVKVDEVGNCVASGIEVEDARIRMEIRCGRVMGTNRVRWLVGIRPREALLLYKQPPSNPTDSS